MTLSRNWPKRPRAGRSLSLAAGVAFTVVTLTGGLLAAHRLAARAERPALQMGSTTRLDAPLSVLWKFSTAYFPNNPSSPVVTDDGVFIAAGNRVYAVDPKTGTQKWRYPSDLSATLPGLVPTTPTYSNGTLFFGAGSDVYALNAADGKPRWVNPFQVRSGIATSPIVNGDGVFFGAQNGRLYGVDIRTGELLKGAWSTGKRPGVEAGGDIIGDIAVTNGLALYMTSNQFLHALDLSSGVTKWAQRVDLTTASVTPVISGEMAYINTGNAISAWRIATGTRQSWRVVQTPIATSPAVDDDGNVYFVNADRRIFAMDPRWRNLWKQVPQVPNEVITQPVLAGDLLIVGTTLGSLYAFDRATGAVRWNYDVQASATNPHGIPLHINIAAKPVVSNGTLYLLTDDGTLTTFRNDAPDSLPPTVTVVEPDQGEYLNGRPPFHIRASVVDEGSGLDLTTMSVKLDNTPLPARPYNTPVEGKASYTFDSSEGMIEFSTLEGGEAGSSANLTNGHHTITVSVKDWKGNAIVKTWSFYIDDTIPKRRRNTGTTGGPGGTGGNSGGIRGPGGGGKLGGGGG